MSCCEKQHSCQTEGRGNQYKHTVHKREFGGSQEKHRTRRGRHSLPWGVRTGDLRLIYPTPFSTVSASRCYDFRPCARGTWGSPGCSYPWIMSQREQGREKGGHSPHKSWVLTMQWAAEIWFHPTWVRVVSNGVWGIIWVILGHIPPFPNTFTQKLPPTPPTTHHPSPLPLWSRILSPPLGKSTWRSLFTGKGVSHRGSQVSNHSNLERKWFHLSWDTN